MKKIVDIIGKKFGRYIVISRANNGNDGRSMWFCRCECGGEKIVSGKHLKSGRIKSCGCYKKEISTKHGFCGTKIYRIWKNMIQRCINPRVINYKNYGGRGIVVCERWMKFENFLKDMGSLPTSKHQIDRINNDLGYYKENCRWSTSKQNNRNRRNNHLLELNDKTECLSEWEEETGIKQETIRDRIKRGWSNKDALTINP